MLDAEELRDARLHLSALSSSISARARPASLASTRSNASFSPLLRQLRNTASRSPAARISPVVKPLSRRAQTEANPPSIPRVRRAQYHTPPREPRHHAAHLALVDAGGAREVAERERLLRGAEERDRAPFPQAHAELAPVAQLRAARQQVRHQCTRYERRSRISVIEERRLVAAAQPDVEAERSAARCMRHQE